MLASLQHHTLAAATRDCKSVADTSSRGHLVGRLVDQLTENHAMSQLIATSGTGAVHPLHCSTCLLYKVTPGVYEFLGQRTFHRKGPPSSSIEQNTWFCPVCGECESDRGDIALIGPGTRLLYDPPVCTFPRLRGGRVVKPHPGFPAMRKVNSRARRFGMYFEEYKCRNCSNRARVLIRNRARPYVLDRGREMPIGEMWHHRSVEHHPVTGRGCTSSPLQLALRIGNLHLIVSICRGCFSMSYSTSPDQVPSGATVPGKESTS